MPWNPDRYHQFQKERSAPFEDALKLITVREGLRVVDLGCGTGELTRRLADHLPGSDTLGVDSSAEMLTRAEAYARPGLRFAQGKIETFASEHPGGWDLIFSHAALQWVDNHRLLIPDLLKLLNPGGQLVVQMPHNFSHVSHRLIATIAQEEPFLTALKGWKPDRPVLEIERYAELLFECGAAPITVFEKVYPHVLENADAIIDWIKGTALVPFSERLGDLYPSFLERIRAHLRAAMPGSPVFYGFRRILFSASLPVE